jgi:FkbM family methyltransferase
VKARLLRVVEGKFANFASQISKTRFWFPFSRGVISEARQRTKVVRYSGLEMRFHIPNDRCLFRADTFLTKEPETINWIAGFKDQEVFWDIGACVGTYTVYAAMAKKAHVVAIEPSIFNLEWLARNVYINNVASQVSIVPLALTSKPQQSYFKMQVTEWGGALSSFGVDYDHEGSVMIPRFEYPTIGTNASALIDDFGLAKPKYVKIDVDSIEHLVLEGLLPHLAKIDSIALENSRNPEVVAICKEILGDSGFKIRTVGRANTIWENLKS